DGVLLCRPGWSAVAKSWLTATSASVSFVAGITPRDSPASASLVAGITGDCQHAWLIFLYFFSVETGIYHVGQAGLKLLTSSDPPTSASHSAEITGIGHCARPTQALL
uniref:Uncharacterized protein n=1 Tax=Macaca fascicularis TaxID=9541 RepID=A0A7N9DE00_MACFA